MIERFLKSHFTASSFVKAIALLILIWSVSSCGDQGCIEADDFGEYQTQILTIPANASEQSCEYDSTKGIADSDQQQALKTCFTTGIVSNLSDGTTSLSSTSGCLGFNDHPVHQNLCIQDCVQKCLAANQASTTAKPNWKSTDPKLPTSGSNTVSILPGAEVSIAAIGTVTLSDKINLPDVFLKANTGSLQYSKNTSWEQSNYYVKSGQTRDLRFSGIWNNGTKDIGSGNNATVNTATFNGGKRLVAYVIPHLASYGDNVPSEPDTSLWRCAYDNSNIKTQVSCFSGDYSAPILNTIALSLYSITADAKGANLGTTGGSIRWNGDNLESASFEPIKSGTYPCDSYPCSVVLSDNTAIDLLDSASLAPLKSTDVKIYKIGDEILSGNVEKVASAAGSVSFKSLLSSNSCNIPIVVKIFDADENLLYTHNISVTNTDWSATEIALEPNQKLIVTSFSTTYTVSGNSTPLSCGEAIAIKFLKYQDITINKSGYVSFARLTTELGSSGSCSINGRIINPNGNQVDKTVAGFNVTADYYEYNDFNTATTDGLNNLSVPIGTFSGKVYVRKGQIIRFSPKSWNGSWVTAVGKSRQCGIGTVMKIEQRPAFLCRGQQDEYVDNTDCVQEFSGSTLLGCKAYAAECSDENSSSYCIDSSTTGTAPTPVLCTGTVTCGANGSSPNYQRTGCTSTTGYNNSYCNFNNTINATKCANCLSAKLTNAKKAAKISMNLDQCYDLENYQGKVNNIPTATGFSTTQLDNGDISKGAALLDKFNGSYGNFSNFYMTDDVDSANNNKVFQSRDVLTFNSDGILKFLVLDGSDFNGTPYADNSASGPNYAGTNGYKVSFSAIGQYRNGEWLEVKLCEETIDDQGVFSTNCRSSDIPSGSIVSGVPKVIEFNNVASETFDPIPTTDFNYNSYGNLTKIANSDPNKIVDQSVGTMYYMHKHYYKTQEQIDAETPDEKKDREKNISKLRLSFRIKDPEVGNCNLPSGGTNNGIKTDNPAYTSGSGNTNAFCGANQVPVVDFTTDVYPGKTQCLKQFYCADIYSNNSGQYDVTVRVKDTKTISNFIGTVVDPVIEIMDGKKSSTPPDCKSSRFVDNFDGKKTLNNYYDSSDSANTGATCYQSDVRCANNQSTCNASNILCKKQYVCVASNQPGQAEIIYNKIVNDIRYKSILNISLIIMITFYGVGFLMGVSDFTSSEIFGRTLKIGLIYLFVSPTGWEFFNGFVVQTFKQGTDHLAFLMASSFDDSPLLAEALKNDDFYNKSILFSSVDRVWGLFFNDAVQKKIAGLLFASIFGWIYVIVIYYGFFIYIGAVSNAVLLYLTAQVFISILFILAPIFFVFTLFNQTKSMFDNWLKNLIGFSLQQIFLLTTLAFFNMMMYEVIKMALAYKVCWDEVWVINILTRIKLMSFWTLASMPPVTDNATDVANIGVNSGIPSLFTILFIWIIANLMSEFIDFMTNLAQSIGGGIKVTELAAGVKKTAEDMGKSFAEHAWKKTGREVEQRLDQALFDSGKLAKQERKKQKAKNQKDIGDKSALRSAGEQAMSDYKKFNAAEFTGMSKEEQRKKLEEVKNKGISDKGKKMGLSDSEIERLKADSGVKYVGENLLGYAASAAKQRGLSRRSGGNLGSLKDEKVDTRFSSGMKYSPFRSDVKSAMKHAASDADRAKIKTALVSGDIGVKGSAFLNDPMKRRQDSELRTHLLPEELSDKYYKQAESELEKEGAISKMKFLGSKKLVSWARNDAEKAKIKEREQKLRDDRTQKRADDTAKGGKEARSKILENDIQRAERFEAKYNEQHEMREVKSVGIGKLSKDVETTKDVGISSPRDGHKIESEQEQEAFGIKEGKVMEQKVKEEDKKKADEESAISEMMWKDTDWRDS